MVSEVPLAFYSVEFQFEYRFTSDTSKDLFRKVINGETLNTKAPMLEGVWGWKFHTSTQPDTDSLNKRIEKIQKEALKKP